MSAVVAQAARDLASELDGIGTTQFDSIARAFRHFADFVDGREPSPASPTGDRRARARRAIDDCFRGYDFQLNDELVDEIIDAVDLA